MGPKKVKRLEIEDETVETSIGIEKLPSEIVHLVFTHLRKPELARAALVCRKWAAVAADPRLWEALRFPLNITNSQLDTLTDMLECPRFSLGVKKVYLDNCKASSDHLRALSAGGLKALTIGRNCKLSVRGQLLEEIASNMEEVTVLSRDLTKSQWTGLLQGLAKASNLKKLEVEPLPRKVTLELVNLLEKVSMRVTSLALAVIWPRLIQGIADRGRCAVTNLDLHGVDLDLESTALTSAFHKLTILNISYCKVSVNHLNSLLGWGFISSCLSELNLEGIDNLKKVSSNSLSRLDKLDKLNLSNTGLSTAQYREYFGNIMRPHHRTYNQTNSSKKFPSELSLCCEQAISTLPPYLHHIFAKVRVLDISCLSLKPDQLKMIFKKLGDQNNFADLGLEELIICDTSLASLGQGLLANAVLKLRKANIARCSLSLETVSYLLEEVATRVQGKRLRELDVNKNTSGVDLGLVIRARYQLDVLKVHSGCQCCF